MIKWFKNRREDDDDDYEYETEVFVSEVPVTTMLRWFIYDIGYGKEKIDELMGLTPMSEEGEDKEEQDSKKRIRAIQPLVPFMDLMSDASANIFSTVAMTIEESIPEEEREEMEELLGNLYKSIALSSIVGTLSVANALGLIDVTAFSSKLQDMGDMYDE